MKTIPAANGTVVAGVARRCHRRRALGASVRMTKLRSDEVAVVAVRRVSHATACVGRAARTAAMMASGGFRARRGGSFSFASKSRGYAGGQVLALPTREALPTAALETVDCVAAKASRPLREAWYADAPALSATGLTPAAVGRCGDSEAEAPRPSPSASRRQTCGPLAPLRTAGSLARPEGSCMCR